MNGTRSRGLFYFIIISIMWLSPFSLAMGDIIFIANKSVVVDTLSRQEIKEIFTGRQKRWPDGMEITIVLLIKSEVLNEFTIRYTHKTVAQYENWWKRMVFTGQGRLPRAFGKTDNIKDYVAKTEGAIGFITEIPEDSSLKIISITQ